MTNPVEALIERFIAVFGEPKTPNPDVFLAEYREAMGMFSESVLRRAGSQMIRKNVFWPKPSEVYEAANCIAAEDHRKSALPRMPEPDLAPPNEAAKARAAQLVRQAKAAIHVDTTPTREIDWTAATRGEFERMQRTSPNRHLHIARRMTGDDT